MKPGGSDVVRPAGHHITNQAFRRAIIAARHAPSAYDTQPWRWRVSDMALDLYADHSRMSAITDPGGRLAIISCGAALHHARLALVARGWRVKVIRCPDVTDPGHLASLRIEVPAPVSAETTALAHIMELRRTGTRPVTGEPVEPEALRTIVTAFEAQHVRFELLRPDQFLEFTVTIADDASTEPAAAQWQRELAVWAASDRIVGTGLPTASGGPERAATFAVLHGERDQPLDWLHAGEALSGGSLVAFMSGVSVLPFSAPIEFPAARAALARITPDLGCPYLIVILGRHLTDIPRSR